ncbi:MAG: damage-inducible protein CinA [Coxiella sp. DG_40]|nr:MAG: damage-inducible protein CinA [Coxiella sp. DG_40]
MEINFDKLARRVGSALKSQKLMLATAESCTAGQVAYVITSVSGSADWFERGFITYSNIAKQEMLGVNPKTLEHFGAVSEQTAKEMAEGALMRSNSQISIAVTGIAGPTGGSKEKPVGTVCFAWARKDGQTNTTKQHFKGDRNSIRSQATQFALEQLPIYLSKS